MPILQDRQEKQPWAYLHEGPACLKLDRLAVLHGGLLGWRRGGFPLFPQCGNLPSPPKLTPEEGSSGQDPPTNRRQLLQQTLCNVAYDSSPRSRNFTQQMLTKTIGKSQQAQVWSQTLCKGLGQYDIGPSLKGFTTGRWHIAKARPKPGTSRVQFAQEYFIRNRSRLACLEQPSACLLMPEYAL